MVLNSKKGKSILVPVSSSAIPATILGIVVLEDLHRRREKKKKLKDDEEGKNTKKMVKVTENSIVSARVCVSKIVSKNSANEDDKTGGDDNNNSNNKSEATRRIQDKNPDDKDPDDKDPDDKDPDDKNPDDKNPDDKDQDLGEKVVLEFDFQCKENEFEPLFSGVSWGAMLWDASIALGNFLEKQSSAEIYKGKTVVELGACCGLPGLICALNGAKKVVLTDMQDYMDAVDKSIQLNGSKVQLDDLHSCELTWGEETALQFVQDHGHADVILCSDCVSTDVYGRSSWLNLIKVLEIILHPSHGRIIICSVRRPNDGLDEFLGLLEKVYPKFQTIVSDEFVKDIQVVGALSFVFVEFHQSSFANAFTKLENQKLLK